MAKSYPFFSLFENAAEFFAFCGRYRDFLGRTISLADAERAVRTRLASREASFLELLRDNVYANPGSPYLRLMQIAQCELGDLEHMVSSQGLEQTLLTLRREGVYIAFEEYKGRVPMVRSGREVPIGTGAFRNRNLKGVFDTETGGSTGVSRRINMHLDHYAVMAETRALALEAHGVRTAPLAVWKGTLPDPSGPGTVLRSAKYGQVAEKWFRHVTRSNRLKYQLKAAIYNRAILTLGRLSGVALPEPEALPLDSANVVARWMAETLKTHGRCVLSAQVSKAVRVALAAGKAGYDLTGAAFTVSGEPLTPAKSAAICRTGAVAIPMYTFSEHGAEAGSGCGQPIGEDEIHLFQDLIEIVQFPRKVPGHDITVDAFNVTSLSPTAPNILLNVESDDFGIIEERHCGCGLDSIGYRKHIRGIRSYQKLTGEGVTLIGTDAIRALEEVLPARFGGTPLDYQLAEEEDDDGMTRVSLIVDPGVSIANEQEVIDTFFQATGYDSLAQVWGPVRTLRVKRETPRLSGRGKLIPLYLSAKSRDPENKA